MRLVRFAVTVVAALAALVAPGVASAVPAGLHQQGRFIADEGFPLEGPHALTVRLYDTPVGGQPRFQETFDVVLESGYYAVIVGQDVQNPIPAELWAQYPIYIGIALDSGAEFTPRHEIVSVPYALMAHTAVNQEGGTVDAEHISVNGSLVVDAGGHWVGPPIDVVDTLEALGCTAGQGIVFTGSAWACADADHDVYAKADQTCPADSVAVGVNAAGDLICAVKQDALSGLSCAAGQVAAWSGSAWSCLTLPTPPSYDGSDFALANQGCPAGTVVAGITTTGLVVCVPDQDTDTDTTYQAGAGLSLAGTTFAVVYGPGGAQNVAVRWDDPRLANERPPAPGSNNYVQNQFGGAQPANFYISGHGQLNGNLYVNGGYVVMGGREALNSTDSWLRLNQAGQFSSGVHTPGLMAPGSLNVGGANGWGNPGGGNMWVAGSSTVYGNEAVGGSFSAGGPVNLAICRMCFYYADEKGNDARKTMCVKFTPGSFTGMMRLSGDVDDNDVVGLKYLCDNGPAGIFDGWPWQ